MRNWVERLLASMQSYDLKRGWKDNLTIRAMLMILTNLHTLELSDTQVTDAGLEYLKGMNELQSLGLAFTKVTDAGLEHLKGLKSLQSLELPYTNVTDEGVKKLQQALPECKITRVPPSSKIF